MNRTEAIRTYAELDQLPVGAIFRDGNGDACAPTESAFLVTGSEVPYTSDDPEMPVMPVLLIWHPDWSDQ